MQHTVIVCEPNGAAGANMDFFRSRGKKIHSVVPLFTGADNGGDVRIRECAYDARGDRAIRGRSGQYTEQSAQGLVASSADAVAAGVVAVIGPDRDSVRCAAGHV